MNEKIGERLREERERLGLSQAEFAEKAGIHRNTQVRYESGKREPDPSYIARIQDLGVDAGYLLFARKTDPVSIYNLAVARVLPGIAERAGISGRAVIDLINLAAEEESASWGGGELSGSRVDFGSLIDSLFENGELLSDVFFEVARVCHDEGLHLPYNKRAKVLSMIFRTCKASGKIDPEMVNEAVRLASS